ncbi:sensor histidine kinase [Vibrio scophthalmi]|uniref:histidine kinase n=1 Tax=Vibrio scophthalmi LMG 19158 TaxID=870967 RepID=F9RS30_9VIBR|nr:ATP-binding protein [Vibrio scophthalmi]EGU32534.1 Sensor histidine kinase [Vibrio scophthalmi LMG 19158]
MRRIYLESILVLLACFFSGVIAYEISVSYLTTNYEDLLEDYEAIAYQQMVQQIADNQGSEAAIDAINQFANTTRHILTTYSPSDDLPQPIAVFFGENNAARVFLDGDRDLWFRLTGEERVFRYSPDEESSLHQNVQFETDLVWLFFIASFILYGLGHLTVIFRRVKKLEKVTLDFASGNLSSRALTTSGNAIGTLNKSFNVMADRIHSLIESNRALTNAIAHELRTPIFRIQWQAELLKETPLDYRQSSTIRSIVDDTEEMEQMVDELLYYAKLDSRRLELSKEDIVIDGFLNELIKSWRRETKLEINRINNSLSETVICGDRKLFKRALDNIVRNAIKFADQKITIILDPSDEYLFVSIHDDGPGVEKKHHAQLFEPFYVANQSRNKAKSGHGLGLSIVKKICEQHDMAIKVGRSDVLKGAVFTLCFPLCHSLADNHIQK